MEEHFTGVNCLPSPNDFLMVMMLLYLQHHDYKKNITDLAQWTADLIQFLLDPGAFFEKEETKMVVEEAEKMMRELDDLNR